MLDFNKWKKNPNNWIEIPRTDIIQINGNLLVHPATYNKIKNIMENMK
jgi:hypothetical protein